MSDTMPKKRRTKADMNYPKFPIDDVYLIKTDAHNLIPQKLTANKKGRLIAITLGYCSTFKHACLLLKNAGCTADLSELESLKCKHDDALLYIVPREVDNV